LPAPLRILVAIGAPDEDTTSGTVLDYERELQTILDAVDQARRYGNAEVKILEVGQPDQIRRALLERSYHVLHISGHGRPGRIELEDEDGRAVAVTPQELTAVIRESGRRPPLVFLATCLSGAGTDDTTGFAQGLLAHGLPLVLAMQTSVSDWYATAWLGPSTINSAAWRSPRPVWPWPTPGGRSSWSGVRPWTGVTTTRARSPNMRPRPYSPRARNAHSSTTPCPKRNPPPNPGYPR